MKQHLKIIEIELPTKAKKFFYSLGVAELIRQYHITSGNSTARNCATINLKKKRIKLHSIQQYSSYESFKVLRAGY